MICSDCGREIANGSVSCEYCGKVFVSQRARPEEHVPHEAVAKLSKQLETQELATDTAVSFRRKQRWIFYAVIVVLFIGSLVMVINLYSDFTKLNINYAQLDLKYKTRESELERISKDLDATQDLLNDSSTDAVKLRDDLAKNRKNLADMTDRNKKIEEEMAGYKQSADSCSAKITASEAVNYNLIVRLGLKLSSAELAKIPVALSESALLDTDKDGLVDELELAIGSDELKTDSDGDGYNDKAELEQGFNPVGDGKLPSSSSEALKGRIVYSDNNGSIMAWYVGLNGKRNYLGLANNGFAFMLANSYWTKK